MGREIPESHFSGHHFQRFEQRLRAEQTILREWFREGRWSEHGPVAGAELEAWLVDGQGEPLPVNEPYLRQLDDPQVVAELARFNVELNVAPQPLHAGALSRLQEELERRWQRCERVARELDARTVMIGILPTLRNEHLVAENMSALQRYRALNEQVLRLRKGTPLRLEITGSEHLDSRHHDVMLEAATTSWQVHLQVRSKEAAALFNASMVASAATVAVAANSPFLFGKVLWEESRIPLFEQAVEVGGYAGAAGGPVRRVTFGSGYVRHSLEELFRENLEHYPILLPVTLEEPPRLLPHLRLHNGTIWRWNRPLIGFDSDGTPHLRIEHRVMAAGPTIPDMIANSAFYYGLAIALARNTEPGLPFATARDNFYAAARHGLQAVVQWMDGKRHRLNRLIPDNLLPLAESGLRQTGLFTDDIRRYLGIIERRVRKGQNGAAWQRTFVARNGRDMAALTLAYLRHQQSGIPVHEWDL